LKNNKLEIGFLTLCSLLSGWILLSSFTFSSNNNSRLTHSLTSVHYTFGFSLQPTYNSGLVSFWLVGETDGKIVYKYPLTTANFIRQMKGEQRSGANKIGTNLFEEHQLDHCFYEYYWNQDKYGPLQCFRLNDLWALRYNRNPLCPSGCVVAEGMRELGWAAGKASPNEAQMAILKSYGISSFQNIIYGESMFNLWYDMKDASWQSTYASAGSSE